MSYLLPSHLHLNKPHLNKPLHKVHEVLPHKNEIVNEHFVMAFAYGIGAYLAHSPLGLAVVGTFYLISGFIHVDEDRKNHAS